MTTTRPPWTKSLADAIATAFDVTLANPSKISLRLIGPLHDKSELEILT